MTYETLPTVAALADPRAAIAFALGHLPSYELADFLSEWREGKDLLPWLEAVAQDRRLAADIAAA